jgi:GntR family transcriptional repressor for pyruvate dehydrogenase complex
VVRDFQTLFRLGRVALAQLVEARALIEPESARLAAVRANEPDVKAVLAALDARAETGAPGRRRRSLDAEFHRLIAAAARNPVHAVVTAEGPLEVRQFGGGHANLTAEDDAAIVSAHRNIYEAIVGRDPEAARAAMHAHLLDVEQRLGRVGVERAAS